MKKLDKLILYAFLGPFLLTFAVVEFILLTQYMLKYMEDFVGKGLGLAIFGELLFYFSLNMAPVALPLAVLLSSLITFGNLGEHNELSAIKTSGISLLRILRPVFVIVIAITIGAFFFNNYIVPKANLKAYSLLWDIRQKKPSLDFKEGAFYNGLPGYSIKINRKYDDDKSLGDLMIYDHTTGRGNTSVTLADSGRMYLAYQDHYLVMELFNGVNYNEQPSNQSSSEAFVRSHFKQSRFVFSMASFNLDRTKEELFAQNKMMKQIDELQYITDSLRSENTVQKTQILKSIQPYYTYFKTDTSSHHKATSKLHKPIYVAGTVMIPDKPHDTPKTKVALPEPVKIKQPATSGSKLTLAAVKLATNKARSIRSFLTSYAERVQFTFREANTYEIEIHRKYTQSIACLIMFLIGAPLGAIIKKGGLGVPVLISIIFFILFYILTILGEKWGREGLILVWNGMWMANFILFPMGLFFLYQARNDSSLLEFDAWRRLLLKLRRLKV